MKSSFSELSLAATGWALDISFSWINKTTNIIFLFHLLNCVLSLSTSKTFMKNHWSLESAAAEAEQARKGTWTQRVGGLTKMKTIPAKETCAIMKQHIIFIFFLSSNERHRLQWSTAPWAGTGPVISRLGGSKVLPFHNYWAHIPPGNTSRDFCGHLCSLLRSLNRKVCGSKQFAISPASY